MDKWIPRIGMKVRHQSDGAIGEIIGFNSDRGWRIDWQGHVFTSYYADLTIYQWLEPYTLDLESKVPLYEDDPIADPFVELVPLTKKP
jgi:hypothetical protein